MLSLPQSPGIISCYRRKNEQQEGKTATSKIIYFFYFMYLLVYIKLVAPDRKSQLNF